jgi:hypothetical protein
MASDGVSFDDDPMYSASPAYSLPKAKTSLITGLVVKAGIARTEKEANIILIVLIIACIFLTVVVYIAVEPHAHPVSPAQFKQDLDRMHAVERAMTTR